MVTTRLSYASPPCCARRTLLTATSFPPKPNVAAAGRRSQLGARRRGWAAPASAANVIVLNYWCQPRKLVYRVFYPCL